ncbi:MAG: L,D-transpeptidase [Christensenellales bacterium]
MRWVSATPPHWMHGSPCTTVVYLPTFCPCLKRLSRHKKRPPWGTSLGGEIYIHGGGNAPDWTAGRIALSDADMAVLFAMAREGDTVRIIP